MNRVKQSKKKAKDSLFRRVNNWLHLWLGLVSGIIVFIVCITGCLWVFQEEITDLLEPESRVAYEEKPVLSPSELAAIGQAVYPGWLPSYANYHQGKAVNLTLRKAGETRRRGGESVLLKVNPYTGTIISEKRSQGRGDANFFRFVLDGHRALWLPYDIGRPIVNYGTLIFVVLLITGLVWWYPKKWNKSTRDKSFKIKWGASFKRVNLDLHNVLGFYSLLFLLAIALTGMVYGLQWYSKGLYWVTTGGQKLENGRRMQSDSTQRTQAKDPNVAMDLLWNQVLAENPASQGFYYNYPDRANPASTIYVIVYPRAGQFYNSRSYLFDQYTLQPITRNDPFSVAYEKASFGQKLRKMNYDIHVGSILGLPGKVLAFLASLIGASLPITGFLIWWGKRNKKPRKSPAKAVLPMKRRVPVSMYSKADTL
ncbi:PepSY domain-containing protein [Olivibacter sp. XZL3]|uniref:PepSY-associated TM helix domain-containing protein n=1 Tax=Olivibacter sp. XZL3 TaxID=1735116 RepID=UPI001066E81C|nr:PepSY-associated TM helix domain-containing protein [Olivibacter sp. XZL3]